MMSRNILLNLKNLYLIIIPSFMTIGSQMPKLDWGGAFLPPPPPYKIGSENTPYKLRLKIVNFVAINLNYWYFRLKSSDFPP